MKKLFLSNFQLKLIAIISMTIDHVGLFLFNMMPENSTIYIVSTICRYIGRLALPLFCFLLVEGVLHTHNFKKYMLRLGIVAFCIALFQSFGEIMYYASKANIDYRFQSTNIFITLILGALMIYCFENKNKGVKSLGLIPIAISICAFVCTCLEWENNITIWWFPYLLRPEYDWLGIGMILVFYGAYKIVPKLYDYYGFKSELYLNTFNYRVYVNTFCFLGLTIPTNRSVMFGSLSGSKLGIWVAHGEGKFSMPYDEDHYNIVAKYSYDEYPGNPNGSDYSTAAVASADGRHLAIMPHLERAIFPWQNAYYPIDRMYSDQVTPWIEAFVNARKWVEEKVKRDK